MTISASTKIRAIGGASVIALSTGLAASAAAQEMSAEMMGPFTETVVVGNGETFVLAEGDTITTAGAAEPGISAGDNAVITNDGTITATGDQSAGILAGIQARITNTGAIESGLWNGIELDSGRITNSGSIIASSTGLGPDADPRAGILFTTPNQGFSGVDFVTNEAGGLIEGDIGIFASDGTGLNSTVDNGSQVVSNAGTIIGRNGVAVSLGLGLDQFTQFSSGTTVGIVDAGTGEDTITNGFLPLFGSGVAGDIFIYRHDLAGNLDFDLDELGADGQFRNFEQFSFGMTGVDPAGNDILDSQSITLTGSFDDAEFIGLTGDIILEGTIDANVRASGSLTVTSNGSVSSDAPLGDLSLTDNAEGVELFFGANLTNDGSITSMNGAGVLAAGVLDEETVNVIINNGTISGVTGYLSVSRTVFVFEPGANASTPVEISDGVQIFSNFGTLNGTGGIAADLGADDDTFKVFSSGTINGIVDGGDGFDTLIFDVVDMSLFESPQFINFEAFGFDASAGDAELTGDNALALTLTGGAFTVSGEQSATLTLGEGAELTVDGGGSVVTDGDGEIGVIAGDGNTLVNDGTISTTGDGATGVQAGDDLILVNTSDETISTTGNNADGVSAGDDADIDNTGTITTSGANSDGIDAGDRATITNSGLIETSGNSSVGIQTGEEANIDNSGDVFTSGDNGSHGLAVGAGSVITNSGTIFSEGEFSFAIDASGAGVTITNTETGNILAAGFGSIGIAVANDATITNDGFIATLGDNAAAIDAFNRANITNTGEINTDGFGAFGISTLDDSTVTNTGVISTINDLGVGISVGFDSTVINDGTISTLGDSAFGIFAEDGAEIILGADSVIETFGFNAGGIVLLGDGTIINEGMISAEGSQAITVLGEADITNSGMISSEERALDLGDNTTLTNEAGGVIRTIGNFDTIEVGDNFTLVNDGTIRNGGVDQKIIDAGDNATITNNGVITSSWKGIEGDENLTVTNTGRIFSLRDEAIEADGAGLVVVNDGEIISPEDDAIDGGDNVSITNTGLIQGGQNDGLELNSGTIINSGTIESLSSDPDGDFIMGTMDREIDAAIDFDGGTDGNEDGMVMNMAGGVIIGDIGINTSSGATGSDANEGVQTIVNFGTITGRGMNPETGRMDAVLLGEGDDVFQQWQTGVTNGTVDGQGGEDTLVFGNDSADLITRDVSNISDPLNYTGFEVIGFLDIGGGIRLTGTSDLEFAFLGGDFTIAGDLGGAFVSGGADSLTVEEGGMIDVEGDDAVVVSSDDFVITNNGLIRSNGGDAIAAGDDTGLTVVNNGTILADVDGDNAIDAGEGLTLTNTGMITATSSPAIAVISGTIANSGEIDNGIEATGELTVDNTGTISSATSPAISLGSGTITNTGTIENTAMAMDGGEGGAPAAVDAAIEFTGTGDSTVTNNAGGLISGGIGISGGDGAEAIVNFGTITGTATNPESGRMDAVALGGGADAFQQWSGAVVNGWIDLGGGDDTFILEGAASSVSAGVIGGMGTDTAILAGDLDADNLSGFELFQLGSTLGGTLNDLVITGNRTVDGDVVHVGVVTVGLGVDSLTATGSITLEDTGVLNIETPLDEELIGQTVLVLDDGTGFTNNGATVNIIDDDLLLDYTPVIGSLAVQVSAANPLVVSSNDPNVQNFGTALAGGVTAGTLSSANFDLLNDLTASQLESYALDALPNASEGEGREIFETSQLASQALNRHLASGSSGIWGQAAYRAADSDGNFGSSGGYQSDQLVFTVGGDLAVGENGQVGVLVSYADIENEDRQRGNTRGMTEIESFKFGGYGAFTFGRGFLNAELAYLTGEIESTRNGLLGQIGSAYNFDGFAYGATVGYNLLASGNGSITPVVGISGASIGFDDVTEAGGFGFTVARGDADFFELRAGLELGVDFETNGRLFFQGIYVHDLEDDARTFTLSSPELSTFTIGLPVRDQSRFELAAGANFSVSEAFGIEVGYVGDYSAGYHAHSARATARINF